MAAVASAPKSRAAAAVNAHVRLGGRVLLLRNTPHAKGRRNVLRLSDS
eukprot:CAMPEP_0172772058 /NCGR_PEP_ID=MMETSP1074-20121228/191676_1 /TAXON_ID=2916 /ORGANISM="Ceratium fusus, Strain PA161109" /LENGTH=47 /DNA_ID= /DNA_START= /DNA_END= /DNA_ORIENTATION=